MDSIVHPMKYASSHILHILTFSCLLNYSIILWKLTCNKIMALKHVWIIFLIWIYIFHHSDATWAPWHLKLLATQLFVSQLVQAHIKKKSKLSPLALCEGNPPVTDGSPHRGPVMQKALTWYDIIMMIYVHMGQSIQNSFIIHSLPYNTMMFPLYHKLDTILQS